MLPPFVSVMELFYRLFLISATPLVAICWISEGQGARGNGAFILGGCDRCLSH